MGTTKQGEIDVRKIQKTGRGGESYMITLPKAYVRKLKWQVDQKVVVELDGDQLIVKDWQQ